MGLRSLSLGEIPASEDPLLGGLIGALASCSSLEYLALENVGVDPVAFEKEKTPDVLVLPNLVHLGIDKTSSPLTLALLRIIRAGSLQSFRLASGLEWAAAETEAVLLTLAAGDAHDGPLRVMASASSGTLQIRVTCESIRILLEGSDLLPADVLVIEVARVPWAVLRTLLRSVSIPITLSLIYGVGTSDTDDVDLSSFTRLYNLRTVCVLGGSGSAVPTILLGLSSSSQCPNLKEVSIDVSTLSPTTSGRMVQALEVFADARPEVGVFDGDGIRYYKGIVSFLGDNLHTE